MASCVLTGLGIQMAFMDKWLENFQRDDDEQLLYNPTTGSREHNSLFDPFHEKKTPLTQLIRCVVFLASDNLPAR